ALGRVRGLTGLLEASLQEARAGGAPAAELRLLSDALAATRGASLDAQATALRRLAECLQAAPVNGPGAAAVADSAPVQPVEPSAPPVPSAPAPASAAKGRSRQTKKPEAEPSPSPRTLSIAPTNGPLAVPLRRSGIRINPRLLSALEKKGLLRVGDILFLLPRGYEDRRRLSTLRELVPGMRGVTVGTVRAAGEVSLRPGRRVFRAVLADSTGSIAL